MNLDEIDKTFKQDLIESDKYVDIAINYFLKHGYHIHKPVTKIRPNISVRNEYSDRGDFNVLEKRDQFGCGWVDVKHRSLEKLDIFDDLFVCPKHEFDKNPCWLYFIINKSSTMAMLIHGSTYRQWEVIRTMSCGGPREEGKIKRERSFYTARKDLFKVVEL